MTSHWVFGYGSLMWNPGFPYLRRETAELAGFHRELCVYSFHYRGTPENMGLVFGLAPGGQCQGVAFEVATGDWPQTLHYLREREQITSVYLEVQTPVFLAQTGQTVEALTYVVDEQHQQCALGLSDEAVLELVRNGAGIAGRCLDYVYNTNDHLTELGIKDPKLSRLIAQLGRG
jgi:glutathione-specific gamma-glutamylcyclotransferase